MASEPGCIVWSTTLFEPVMAPLHQTMNGVDCTCTWDVPAGIVVWWGMGMKF